MRATAATGLAWRGRLGGRPAWLRATAAVVAAVAAATAVAACGGDERTPVHVFAAASLAAPFEEMARRLEGSHPDLDIRLNVAGTTTLVLQVEEGAAADVVATADEAGMDRLQEGGHVRDPAPFAGNRLVVVVPAGNPRGVTGLADLNRPGITVALGEAALPAGRYARQAFARAGVAVPRATLEASATAVVTRVALGEADAGVAYATDVAGVEGVEAVAVADDHQPPVRYHVAVAVADESDTGATAGGGAAVVRAWLLGAEGRDVLARHGFTVPEEVAG